MMINKLFPLICAMVMVSACSLEDIPKEPGQKCDFPKGSELKILEGTTLISPVKLKLDKTDLEWLKVGLCIRDYPVCIQGEQESYCRQRCPEGQILCDAECINPKKDNFYCGASGSCSSDDPNDENFKGMICENATCNEGKCEEISVQTVSSCGKEKINCLSVFGNFNQDALECREDVCAIKEEYSESGGCTSGYHRDGNKCVPNNTIDHCGDDDRQCTKEDFPNSTDVQCYAYQGMSMCAARMCAPNFHIFMVACEADDDENCGNHGVSCETYMPANGLSITCQSGSCKLNKCDSGYHVFGNTCEEDDEQNCGAHEKLCTLEAKPNSVAVTCESGVCKATECDAYTILDNGNCLNTNIADCAGVNCLENFDHFKASALNCVEGVCMIRNGLDSGDICEENYHFENEACTRNNTDEHCGPEDQDCSQVEGARSYECYNGMYCKIDCDTSNYYLDDDNRCKQNDNYNCGQKGKWCRIENIPGSTKVGCVSGDCLPLQCTTVGYHEYTNNGVLTCEKDSMEHCGAHGNSCVYLTNNLPPSYSDFKEKEIECRNKLCSAANCLFFSFSGVVEIVPCEGDHVSYFSCSYGELGDEFGYMGSCVPRGCMPGDVVKTDNGTYAHQRYVLVDGKCIAPNTKERCGNSANALQTCTSYCVTTGCSTNDKYCSSDNVEDTCLTNHACSDQMTTLVCAPVIPPITPPIYPGL